jgi:hypothetical protein
MNPKILSHLAILIIATGATYAWRMFAGRDESNQFATKPRHQPVQSATPKPQADQTAILKIAEEDNVTKINFFDWPTSHAHLIPISPVHSDASSQRVSDRVAGMLKLTPDEQRTLHERSTEARKVIVGRIVESLRRTAEVETESSKDVWSFGGVATADICTSLRTQFEEILGRERAKVLLSISENAFLRQFESFSRIHYISIERDSAGSDFISFPADEETILSGSKLPAPLLGFYQPIIDAVKSRNATN